MLARLSALPWKLLHPSVMTRGSGMEIHLTFDDGPHPVGTPKLLNILRLANARSTFFVTGDQASKYPELLRQIVFEGHVVGNHGRSHRSLLFRRKEFVREEILATDDAIRSLLGVAPAFFRPPFGYTGRNVLRVADELGKRVVLWSYDLRDFRAAGRTRRLANAIDSVSHGEVILLHDNEVTASYLDSYLPAFLGALGRLGHHFSPLHP